MHRLRFWSSIRSVYSWKVSKLLLPHRVLQLADGLRIEQVILAVLAVLIMAADHEFGLGIGERLEGVGVLHLRFARQHVEPDAFDARCGAGEVGFDQSLDSARRLRRPARRDSSAAC